MSTNHNVMNPNEDEDIETDISYRCKLFVEGVPHFVAIGRVYPGGSTMHTVPMLDDLVRVVVEDIRDATAPVPVPTGEVQVVGDAIGTFISWPKELIKLISTKKVCVSILVHNF